MVTSTNLTMPKLQRTSIPKESNSPAILVHSSTIFPPQITVMPWQLGYQ